MYPRIRPFTTNDYPAVQVILNEAFPDTPITEEQLRFQYEEHHDPLCMFQRWVATYDRRIVAYGLYDQIPEMYNPRKFVIYGVVHPAYEYKGIGSALYKHIMTALSQFDPLSVRAYAVENKKRSVEFLRARGFREDKREWILSLDVPLFDSTQYVGIEDNLQTHGIMIKSLKELEADVDYSHRLYELYNELKQDMPIPELSIPMTYEYFLMN